ncbi:MAG: iron ABC transporter permease [Rhizobiales bacterium]|nr:iron ABC transporter permease [Hyphomicrobiales bacterium]MBO6700091.1 iron ABC transporter permease [Hyphomicrobiales bacterium]MBO6737744.1 iron ABC transporter permease [Hyphomicrobiales bacterium]MBO6913199.1 iron ABC transporter permease [Hyphomicrobiales bacterium]MBO6954243.1 iron ABC transporter permease [Hyphomicrobiales bacterium]
MDAFTPYLVLGIAVLLLALVPIARLLIAAFAPGLEAFWTEISRTASARATLNTFDVALWSSFLSLGLGGLLAFLVGATDMRSKRLLSVAFLLPLMIAPQVTALAWLQLFGPSSALLQTFGLAPPPGSANPMYGREGIILLLGVQHTALAFITLRAGLRAIPGDVIEAARACGASSWRAFSFVGLPMLAPFLAAAFALCFVSSIGNFGIPALLGMPENYLTLPTLIYQRLASFGTGMIPRVATLAVLVSFIAGIGTMITAFVLARYATRIEADKPLTPFALGRFRLPAEIGVWTLNALLLVAPLTALIAASLLPSYGMALNAETFTLNNYVEVLFRQDVTTRAYMNSFMLAGSAALILMALSLPSGYALSRLSGRRRVLFEALVETPYALPGIVLAIAMILLFIRPLPVIGVSLYGTYGIILIAYLSSFYILALRPVTAAFSQLDPRLEEAAAMCGAGFWQRFNLVLVPGVLPAAAAGAVLVFLTAFNELTVSALLWSSGTETLGVVLFNFEDGGYTTLASAVAVVTVLVVLALVIALDSLHPRLPKGTLPWR